MLGKNGVTVNGTLHTPSNMAVPLLSRDIITMGDSSFYFLLPAKRPGYSPASAVSVLLQLCTPWFRHTMLMLVIDMTNSLAVQGASCHQASQEGEVCCSIHSAAC